MFCSNCGTKNEGHERFCTKCGTLLNFVPGQNVPHNFQPYSITKNKEQHTLKLKAMADPFADDELPEEKPVKSSPTVDPFGNPLPIASVFGDSENFSEESSEDTSEGRTHWPARLIGAGLLITAIVLVVANVGGFLKYPGILDSLGAQWESLFKQLNSSVKIDGLGGYIAKVVFVTFYYVGVPVFGLICTLKFFFKKGRMRSALVPFFLGAIGGYVAADSKLTSNGVATGVMVIAVVVIVCNELIPLASKKRSDDDNEIVIPDDAPNPLL